MISSKGFKKVKSHLVRGFTIIELLIGLLISLFIIAVSLTYFVSSARTFNLQTNDNVIQENARFALEILSQNIRLAGLNADNDTSANLTGLFVQSICETGEAGSTNGNSGSQICTKDGANDTTDNNSDRIAVDYVLRNPASTCNGSDVTQAMLDANGGSIRLANIFWTAQSDNGLNNQRALYCQTYQVSELIAFDGTFTISAAALGTSLPLVDGIERMQLQFGSDSNDDGVVERYQSITNLGVANVNSVRSVRVALLINSGIGIDDVANTEANTGRAYTLLDAPTETFTDSILRQIFSTTILLPNGS